jgi:hypothetical protein
MVELDCPKCLEQKRSNFLKLEVFSRDYEIRGTIRCLKDQHERPIVMTKNYLQQLDVSLPGEQSSRLNLSVPDDIKDDIREAERANYAQCYKACVTMCRRALQLGLVEKNIADGKLSVMLKEARASNKLEQNTFDLATTIKSYGDIGVHRNEKLEPEEVKLVIYAAVRMLNELFKPEDKKPNKLR